MIPHDASWFTSQATLGGMEAHCTVCDAKWSGKLSAKQAGQHTIDTGHDTVSEQFIPVDSTGQRISGAHGELVHYYLER